MNSDQRIKSGDQVKTVVAMDPSQVAGSLKRIGGSRSDDLNSILANQTIDSLWLKNSDEKTRDLQLRAVVAGLNGIGPNDELEGMIAAQLIAAHNAAMECYRRAMIGEQTLEGRRENLSQGNKLSRTYAVLLEALNRHRGKGQQKVTVEHVHVHSGGQAIVGNVEHPGGGDTSKMEKQPHALVYAPGTEMRSENAEPESVPSTGDAERKVPDARRYVDGRTEG
jgi:hypothetical protein